MAAFELPVDVDAVREALRRHGVVFAVLFGSRADGTAGPGSDIDIAVWGEASMPQVWTIQADMPAAVDLTDLRSAPDWLAGRASMSDLVLLDEDPAARVRWQADTRKRYLDEAFRRARHRSDFVAAHG
ncbi:MAG TPA: nucleotidyltransferase domain-containing protein [Euzebya sp.]|nr:nucleotidyltransferase domain-containing protein [Euzebya sp.]